MSDPPIERRPHRYLRIVAAIALAWAGFELVWATVGAPRSAFDTAAAMGDVSRRQQAPGPNGWPVLVEAIESFEQLPDTVPEDLVPIDVRGRRTVHLFEFAEFVGVPLDPADPSHALVLHGLAEMEAEGVLDRLDEALAHPNLVRDLPHTEHVFGVPLLTVSRFRLLAQARLIAMGEALRAGDEAEAARALRHALGLGRVAMQQHFLVDLRIGLYLTEIVLREVRYVLSEQTLDEATALALLEAVEASVGRPDVPAMLEGERLALQQMMDWCFTDDRHGDGRIIPEHYREIMDFGMPGMTWPEAWAQSLIHVGRSETMRLIDDYHAAIALEAEMTAAERFAAGPTANTLLTGLTARHRVVQQILPAAQMLLDVRDECVVRIEGTRIMLALAVHRARHGAYPARLDQLDPDLLRGGVPDDPTVEQPFVYRRDRGYLLYSIGIDGVDGLEGLELGNLTLDEAFDRTVRSGDLLINRPRSRPE